MWSFLGIRVYWGYSVGLGPASYWARVRVVPRIWGFSVGPFGVLFSLPSERAAEAKRKAGPGGGV